jgi:hypothetical protein
LLTTNKLSFKDGHWSFDVTSFDDWHNFLSVNWYFDLLFLVGSADHWPLHVDDLVDGFVDLTLHRNDFVDVVGHVLFAEDWHFDGDVNWNVHGYFNNFLDWNTLADLNFVGNWLVDWCWNVLDEFLLGAALLNRLLACWLPRRELKVTAIHLNIWSAVTVKSNSIDTGVFNLFLRKWLLFFNSNLSDLFWHLIALFENFDNFVSLKVGTNIFSFLNSSEHASQVFVGKDHLTIEVDEVSLKVAHKPDFADLDVVFWDVRRSLVYFKCDWIALVILNVYFSDDRLHGKESFVFVNPLLAIQGERLTRLIHLRYFSAFWCKSG